MRRARRRQAAAGLALGLCLAATAALLLGAVAVVTTSGVSMSPTYHAGDLVLVARADSYSVGQIVAYHDRRHDLVVLHRIVGGDPSGYRFKGDNNASVDAVHPQQADLIGRAVLHVPHAGGWLHALIAPLPIALLATALLTAGGARCHRRRRRRSHSMSRQAVSPGLLSSWSPSLRIAAGATAAGALLGTALAGLAWTTPTQRMAAGSPRPTDQMSFAYSAAVPPSAAYDATVVQAPHPVFRRLANLVEVRFAYRGRPGSIEVRAELTTASGWQSSVPLSARRAISTTEYDGTVRLDLSALEQRARAAAAVTGMPAEQLTVTVVPEVTTDDGARFAPELRLLLTPLRLTLADDPSSLVVRAGPATPAATVVPRTLTLLHQEVTVTRSRTLATGLLLLAGLLALGIVVLSRRAAPTSEGAAIRRRYASLLLPVHPMPVSPGHPVVDVASFATLARLAERYGLLVLHWTRCEVDTFIVQDERTTYRYRPSSGSPGATTDAPRPPDPSGSLPGVLRSSPR